MNDERAFGILLGTAGMAVIGAICLITSCATSVGIGADCKRMGMFEDGNGRVFNCEPAEPKESGDG